MIRAQRREEFSTDRSVLEFVAKFPDLVDGITEQEKAALEKYCKILERISGLRKRKTDSENSDTRESDALDAMIDDAILDLRRAEKTPDIESLIPKARKFVNEEQTRRLKEAIEENQARLFKSHRNLPTDFRG